MEDKDFFDKQTASSRIKASIVAEYFPQYARILLKGNPKHIRYLDLFAGPGKYKDGNLSTPLLLARTCANEARLAEKVYLPFNDMKYSDQLKENFNQLFPGGTFQLEPKFGNAVVGENEKTRIYLEKIHSGKNPYPTLLFFDPWGYKGIDTAVLSKFLNNYGNELFLFVNINRINAAIENDKFDDLMKALFPTTIEELKKDKKYKAKVYQRLSLIMDNLAVEFEKGVKGKLYHCAFKFQEEDSTATSHFIIHFCKHQRGYELVKQIYHDFDNIGATLEADGNYTFDAKRMGCSSLDFGDSNVELLSNQLYQTYQGRIIDARTLFDEHQRNTIYCGTHYVKALRELVNKGKVKASFNDTKEHKVSVLLINECVLDFSHVQNN